MKARQRLQRGFTLIEMMVAVAIGAIVLAALNSVVRLGVNAQSAGQGANELTYQARFALQRMATTARNAAPIVLDTPTAGTTGDWFAPVMYCLNTNSQLIETTTTDTGCTGTTVIANKVSAFSAQVPSGAGTGPVDDPVADLSLTLTDAASNNSVTLATSVRLGGGTQ